MRYAFWLLMLVASTLAAAPGPAAQAAPGKSPNARVLAVRATGRAGAYTFAVTVTSPDNGCERYADWWEVISPDGSRLFYRRILLHSHVEEQPFTRSGGPIPIQADTEVVVRVHVKPLGYAVNALQGSVASGFEPVVLPVGFAAGLETSEPLPTGCWF